MPWNFVDHSYYLADNKMKIEILLSAWWSLFCKIFMKPWGGRQKFHGIKYINLIYIYLLLHIYMHTCYFDRWYRGKIYLLFITISLSLSLSIYIHIYIQFWQGMKMKKSDIFTSIFFTHSLSLSLSLYIYIYNFDRW